jgi:osmotically inducible protein OsmC
LRQRTRRAFRWRFRRNWESAKLTPESISTAATLTMEKLETGWTITAVHLDVTARVPSATAEAFNTAAQNAKAGCPVSKVLNAKITMDAKLG